MTNLNLIAAVRAIFSTIVTTTSVLERNLNALDNLSQLGENYTGNMVKEQEILNEKRLKDLSTKATQKYEQEKANWSNL